MTDITPLAPVVAPVRIGNIGSSIFRPFPSSQPFTYRESITFQGLLERMRAWIEDDLIPYLNTDLPGLEDAWRAQVGALMEAVDAALEQEEAGVQQALTEQSADNAQKIAAAIQIIIDQTIEVSDPVVLGVLEATGSATLAFLDGRYSAFTDAALKALLMADGSASTAWLDAHNDGRFNSRYAPKQQANKKNIITGWYHISDFGAKGDGSDDRAAVQAAIDAANQEYQATGRLQTVFGMGMSCMLDVTPYYLDNGNQYGITGIYLRNGVTLLGGTYKCKSGAYGDGALYSVVRSSDSGLKDGGLRQVTVDGNRSGNVQSVQSGAVQIEALDNVWVEDCIVFEANGNGIMVRGATNRYATNIKINRNRVSNCNTIGIQSSQFNGLEIKDNRVEWTRDNAIDIYGEDGSTAVHGVNFDISGNRMANCGNGIFLETVGDGLVYGNHITQCGEGIHVNRINGAPRRTRITANYISGCDKSIACTGDTDGIVISNNTFDYFNSGGVVFGGAGRVSGYIIEGNSFKGNSVNNPCILIRGGTEQAAKIIARNNYKMDYNPDFVNYATSSANLTIENLHIWGE